MAQALAAMGKVDLALAYYEIPLMGQWDPRFGEAFYASHLQPLIDRVRARIRARVALVG